MSALMSAFDPKQTFTLSSATGCDYKVPADAQESEHQICNEDAMIALDASGSMSGKYASANMVRRIEKGRRALAKVLPNITQVRRVGLITFGPGRSNQCNNVKLQLKPTPN